MWTRIITSLCLDSGLEFRMLKSFLVKKVEKYNQEEMALVEKQAEYKAKVTEYLQGTTINPDDSLDSRWNKITSVIHKTANEVFGKTSRKQLNDWFDTEAKKPQRQRTKHTYTCNSKTIHERRLINIKKRDERKNNYIRRRNSMKISRSKNWRN